MKRQNSAVWLESQQRWQINVTKDGKRRTFTCSKEGRTGQRECNAKADRWMEENLVDLKTKSGALSEMFLAEVKEHKSLTRYKGVETFMRNWVLPEIKDIYVSRLTEQNFQNVLFKARKELSDSSILMLRGVMSQYIKYARKNRLTTLQFDDLETPKGTGKTVKSALSESDIRYLFSSDCDGVRHIDFYRMLFLTATRPGELIFLQWTAIDEINNVIKIKGAINTHHETTKGKNQNAVREFPILEEAIPILKRLRLNSRSNFVFCDDEGKHVCENTMRAYWRTFRTGKPFNTVKMYNLRHTFISHNKNIPDAYLAPCIGHSLNGADQMRGEYSMTMKSDLDVVRDLANDNIKKILHTTEKTNIEQIK